MTSEREVALKVFFFFYSLVPYPHSNRLMFLTICNEFVLLLQCGEINSTSHEDTKKHTVILNSMVILKAPLFYVTNLHHNQMLRFYTEQTTLNLVQLNYFSAQNTTRHHRLPDFQEPCF